MNERLKQIIDYYGLTPYAFSQKIGVSEGTIRKILSENTTLRSDNLEKISQSFTEINIDWLITGRGNMLRQEAEISENPSQDAAKSEQNLSKTTAQTLPLIPFEAMAGLPSVDNLGIAFADCEQYLVPDFAARGADCLVRVSGSSMYPKYSNGDILACRIIRDILFFQWGKVYVVDSSQGLLVKRVEQSPRDGFITLVSDNRDRYKPFDIPVADIRTLAIVIGVIRIE